MKYTRKKISPKEALNKAQNICSKQEKCTHDIVQKLKEWGIHTEETGKIIKELIKDNFINEKRYAGIFARDKLRFNKWGKIKIQYALKQKNIPEEYIYQVLDEINDLEYEEILKKEIQKKYKPISNKSLLQVKSKLIRFGLSKGFEQTKVYKIVSQLVNKIYNN